MGAHTSAWDNTLERLGFQGYLELHVAALNAAVEGLPQDRIRIHLCWGNYTGPQKMDAPLTDVGFGTFVGFGAIHPTVAWHKLDSLAEGAGLASVSSPE